MATKLRLNIRQGKTLDRVFRWASAPFLYIPITAIAKTAPVQITAPGFGLPDGWPVSVVSVAGMKEINAPGNGDNYSTDYNKLTVVDTDNLTLNRVNASQFSTYTSGGFLKTPTPVDLAGFIARFVIRDRVGGAEILAITEASGIAIDNTEKTITVTLTATQTAAFSFKKAVYELELESATGEVTTVAYGEVFLDKEVAT